MNRVQQTSYMWNYCSHGILLHFGLQRSLEQSARVHRVDSMTDSDLCVCLSVYLSVSPVRVLQRTFCSSLLLPALLLLSEPALELRDFALQRRCPPVQVRLCSPEGSRRAWYLCEN